MHPANLKNDQARMTDATIVKPILKITPVNT